MNHESPLNDPTSNEPRSAEPVTPAADDKKLETIIDKAAERIPPDQFPTFFRDTLVAFIQGSTGPKTDPETFKIAAATVEKDNENKFTYLMKKLEVEAKETSDDREFQREKFQSTVKMLWPILIAMIVLVIGAISSGIYLAATGHETLGYSILSATVSAVFAYIGGLGTPRFWSSE